MYTQLHLENFKSWEGTGDLRLAPITALFGTNSSGKTSLLQALLLLKQTAESSDRRIPLYFGSQTSLVNLGDFQSVVTDHDIKREVAIRVDWTASEAISIPGVQHTVGNPKINHRLSFTTDIGIEDPKSRVPHVVVHGMGYTFDDASYTINRKSYTAPEYELLIENTPPLQRTQGRAWPLPAPEQFHRFPDQVRNYYQNASFLSDFELALENQLQRTYYLGPLRASPQRTYGWSGSRPSDMGRAGENAVDAILSAVERNETVSQGQGRRRLTLDKYVATQLKQLGVIADFEVVQISTDVRLFAVRVKRTPKSPSVLLTDVGFGVSQILPVVVLLFYVPEGSTIILEQPEIHLHPAVQAALADVLIDAYRKRKVQIILESHSEHLLRRLQLRLAEDKLRPVEVALYFCENDGAHSTAKTLQVDDLGNIVNWPRDFFGDQFGEVARTELARLNRMEATA